MAEQIKLPKVPVGTIHALQDLADRRGCTLSKVLQDAVNTEFDINDRLEKGYEILCKDLEGNVKRLVFTFMIYS